MVRPPSYVEEATFGTFPTNPAMLWIGNDATIDPRADNQSLMTPQLGSEDLKYILKGAEQFTTELEYNLQTSTFAKYAIQAAGGGAGTIDKSLSLLFSARLGGVAGTENFVQLLGSRINSFSLRGSVGQLTSARASIFSKDMPTPFTASPIGAGSFATDPATAPFNFYDGGANPVTIGAATPDVREISVTFERNLKREHVLGDSKVKYLPSASRRITGTITILWLTTAQYANLRGDTGVTITWILKSAVSTLTLTGCKLHRLEAFRFEPTEIVVERYAIQALSASIT